MEAKQFTINNWINILKCNQIPFIFWQTNLHNRGLLLSQCAISSAYLDKQKTGFGLYCLCEHYNSSSYTNPILNINRRGGKVEQCGPLQSLQRKSWDLSFRSQRWFFQTWTRENACSCDSVPPRCHELVRRTSRSSLLGGVRKTRGRSQQSEHAEQTSESTPTHWRYSLEETPETERGTSQFNWCEKLHPRERETVTTTYKVFHFCNAFLSYLMLVLCAWIVYSELWCHNFPSDFIRSFLN